MQRSVQQSSSTWLIRLIVAFAAFIFIGTNDGAGGVLLPSYETFYDLSKSSVSTIFFAGTIGYLSAAFMSGMLTELLGRRLFLSLGAFAMLLGMSVMASVPPWYGVLGALLVVGFGIAVIDAGLNAYVASLPNNAALLNYLHAFYGVGALLGPLLASNMLAAGMGWNRVFVVLAAIAGMILLACALSFNQVRSQPSADHDHASGAMTITLRLPIVWTSAIFLLLYVGIEVSIGSWMFSLLTQERSMDIIWAGRLVSGYWFGLTLGRFVLGSVTKRLGNALMISLCLAGVMLGLALLMFVGHPVAAAFGLMLAGFSLGPIYPTMIALISQAVSERLLPSAVGFMASFGAAGAALFPWIAGKLANSWGVSVVPWYAGGLSLIMLGLWVALQRMTGGQSKIEEA